MFYECKFSLSMFNRNLVIALAILFCILYLQYYTKYQPDIKIIQLELSKININVLNEKYPIVIYDRILRPNDLLKTLFAYTFNVHEAKTILFENKPIINLAKYLVIFNQVSDIHVHLIHPKLRSKMKFIKRNGKHVSVQEFSELTSDITYVTIKLKKDQILILPTFWIYYANLPVQSFHLHDLISYPYEKVFSFIQ